ncbi:hypothetical protein Trydic_g350 [Trypoxylus dichotomus]
MLSIWPNVDYRRKFVKRPKMTASTALASLGTMVLKIIKLIFIMAIMILYRVGFNGDFLGVGGTWNLNEERNPDVEIVASGVFIGYFIYTAVSLINYFFAKPEYKYTFVDIVMNIVGIFLWMAVGAACLHYWINYLSEYWLSNDTPERRAGLALGALCFINGVFFLLDSGLSSFLVIKKIKGIIVKHCYIEEHSIYSYSRTSMEEITTIFVTLSYHNWIYYKTPEAIISLNFTHNLWDIRETTIYVVQNFSGFS